MDTEDKTKTTDNPPFQDPEQRPTFDTTTPKPHEYFKLLN